MKYRILCLEQTGDHISKFRILLAVITKVNYFHYCAPWNFTLHSNNCLDVSDGGVIFFHTVVQIFISWLYPPFLGVL